MPPVSAPFECYLSWGDRHRTASAQPAVQRMLAPSVPFQKNVYQNAMGQAFPAGVDRVCAVGELPLRNSGIIISFKLVSIGLKERTDLGQDLVLASLANGLAFGEEIRTIHIAGNRFINLFSDESL